MNNNVTIRNSVFKVCTRVCEIKEILPKYDIRR